VPTNDDWDALQKYLVAHGFNWDRTRSGNKIAQSMAAQSGWKPFILEGTPGNAPGKNDRSGFSGLAAGGRYDTQEPITDRSPPRWPFFSGKNHKAAWWSATEINESEAFAFGLGFCEEALIHYNTFSKTCGYSVRLVKNGE
jgi:uncharacterized protein (TIGR02145 family)